MEYYDSEERSTPDSCSTSDLGSQNDLVAGLAKKSKSKLKLSNQKKIIHSIFSLVKTQFCHLLGDPIELKSSINDEFFNGSCESLAEKYEFKCCKEGEHDSHCEKKWEKVRRVLIEMVDEELKDQKPIFVVRKRRGSDSKVLLNPLQPFWVHRLLVQHLFSTSNN